MQPEIISNAKATLGEGPAWDAKTGTLYWLDVVEKRVHLHRPEGDGFIQLDEMPGCLAPCKDGRLLVAARASILEARACFRQSDFSRLCQRTRQQPLQ